MSGDDTLIGMRGSDIMDG